MKHAPGPWMYTINKSATTIDQYATVHCGVKKNGIIRESWQPYNSFCEERETEANARLIAAAPELLEALRGFVLNAAVLKTEEPFTGALEKLINLSRKAVAKAEGHSI